MKKFMCVALAMLLGIGALAGCTGTPAPTATPADEPTATVEAEPTPTPEETDDIAADPTAAADTYEIALITDIGTIDDKSFNQGAWEGVVAYATANNITHKYYQPTEQSNDAYLASIELAVQNGAKVVVTPGYLFEEPIYEAQTLYPEVHFILLDGEPHDAAYSYKTESNVLPILYAEQEAGYLAGYAAVKGGMTKLGFMGGMAVPAVVSFGIGFVQGVDAAAAELGVDAEIMYNYTGKFEATPEAQTLASSWYAGGTQVIFGCGGAVGNSVFAAAEEKGAKAIGVDVDQSGESDTVITSAMKGLKSSVEIALGDYYSGAWKGGTTQRMTAANNGVGLPMDTTKIEGFTQADYDALYAKIAGGEITIKGAADIEGTSPKALTLEKTKVTVVE